MAALDVNEGVGLYRPISPPSSSRSSGTAADDGVDDDDDDDDDDDYDNHDHDHDHDHDDDDDDDDDADDDDNAAADDDDNDVVDDFFASLGADDVQRLLTDWGLAGTFAQLFERMNVTGEVLLELRTEDLALPSCGPATTAAHVRLLLKKVQQLAKQQLKKKNKKNKKNKNKNKKMK